MLSAAGKACSSLKDIENSLRKCDSIRYAAYRTSAKLRVLQKAFYLDKVQLKVISCVFERHQLQQTENSVQLHQKEVESVLSDIYFAVKKANDILLDVDYFSELLFKFFLNVFDSTALDFLNITHKEKEISKVKWLGGFDSLSVVQEMKTSNMIQVFSLKVGLSALCEAKPREKYHYLFEQLADHNNCVSRKKLEILLKKMITITEYLGEGPSFGSDLILGTVESCFQCNIGSLGLSEDIFMSWLMQDPQLLVWLSTLYRMQISESVSHNAKCEICKVFPLRGLRYRCLRCLNYDMCQSCFFTGSLSKKHKLKHPVQEYCCPMTSQQCTKAFLLTLRNRLCKKDCKLQYLPAVSVDWNESESLGESTRLLDEMEISSRTVINGSRVLSDRFPYKELQSIISQLERESEKIIPQVENFCRCAHSHELNECRTELKNCLMKHNAQVRAQVERLKLLRNYLLSNGKTNAKAFLASTPVVEENSLKLQKRTLRKDLVDFSPIVVRSSGKREETNLQKKMMWDNYELGAFRKPSWEELESGSRETFSSDVSEVLNKRNVAAEGATSWKDDGSEFDLSSLLCGKTLRELDSSFERGITWLGENENRKSDEEKIREENEETLQELQGDLRRILSKLQELSAVSLAQEMHNGPELRKKSKEVDMTAEVDILLMDLINGIEKLMEN